MQLRVLGPVEASADHRSLPLGGAKQRSVIAMLGLDANRTVSADRLIEGLWGEDAPPSAAKMVQNYVWRLRSVLGDDSGAEILTRGRGYELRIDPDAVDARRFERLLEAGRAAPQRTEHRRRARGAGAVARAAAGGRGRRAVRRVADPSPRGAAVGGDRAGDRRRPGRRPPRRGRGGDRGVDRRAPVAGAAPRPADAGALPMRPPGGGARGVPRRAAGPGRADRRRARPGVAPAARRDPAPGRGARDRGGDARVATSAGCRGVDADRGARGRAGSAAHALATHAAPRRRPHRPGGLGGHGQDPARGRAGDHRPRGRRDGAVRIRHRCAGADARRRRAGELRAVERVLLVVDDADRAGADVRAAISRCGDAARARATIVLATGRTAVALAALPPAAAIELGPLDGAAVRRDRGPVRACGRRDRRTRRRASWTRAAACRDACTTSRANGRGARPRDAWATWRTARLQVVRRHGRWSRS